MADNFVANAGAGGDTFAADDIGGVKFPRAKITLGADGVNDNDVSASNPLPVSGPLTDAALRATPVPVSFSAQTVASTVADGADVNAGTTTDAAVVTDANGTLSGKLRGLVKMIAAMWDSTNNLMKVRQINSTASGTLASVTTGTAINCDGLSTVFIQCTVTATNTTTPQFSCDGGLTWVTASIYPLNANGIPAGASVITITATGKWAVPVGQWKQFRLNMTAFTSNQNVYFIEAAAGSVFTIPIQPTAANHNCTATVSGTVTATQGAPIASTVTAPWGSTPTQGTTLLTTTATSGATTTQTLTATGAAATRVNVRGIYIYGSNAGATCTLVLQDGGATKIDFGTITLSLNAQYYAASPIYTGATAAAITLVVGAASAGTTTASLVADRE